MPPHPTFFLRRECYARYGDYTLKLRSASDYELMLRMLHKHRITVSYLPEVLVKMKVGGKSNISLVNRLKANREDKLAWEMNGLKAGRLTHILKPLSKIGQYFRP
jgi:glycosyltransferase